jgi:Flagellar biosynthesis protein, FliO
VVGMIELLVRLVISMTVVMVVMALAAKFVRRRQGLGPGPRPTTGKGAGSRRAGAGSGGLANVWGGGKSRRARTEAPIDVVYRRALAKGAWVTLVEAEGKRFLVGVTEQSVTLLAELPAAVPPGVMSAGAASAGLTLPAVAMSAAAVSAATMSAATMSAATMSAATMSTAQAAGDEHDDLQVGRMPLCLDDVTSGGRPDNAWKLTLDSLRERTVRR